MAKNNLNSFWARVFGAGTVQGRPEKLRGLNLAVSGQSTKPAVADGLAASAAELPLEINLDLDVDPLAEADVYLAYGRERQAAEIILEAVHERPQRIELRQKLFDIYVQQRDTVSAEAMARQIYAMTNGDAGVWDQLQRAGRAIDPDNALYEAMHRPSGPIPELPARQGWASRAEPTADSKPAQAQAPKPPEDGVIADQGPTRFETVAAADRLGRAKITAALTQLLVQRTGTHPLAVGLFGHWGAGKTSQIEFLKRSLGRYARPRIRFAEFNAWQHEHASDIGAALAQSVVEALVRDLGLFEQLRMAVRLRGLETSRLRRSVAADASRFMATLVPWLSTVPTVILPALALAVVAYVVVDWRFDPWSAVWKGALAAMAAGLTVPLLGNKFVSDHLVNWFLRRRARPARLRSMGLPDFRERMGVNHEIHGALSHMCQLALESPDDPMGGEYLLLVVDDLDRCEPATVKEVLDAVRLVADIQRVVTLVAIDDRIAFAAVSKHFEKFGFAGREPALVARDYLAKVFQVAVTLPDVTPPAASDYIVDELFGADLALDAAAATSDTQAPPRGRELPRAHRVAEASPSADARRGLKRTLPEEVEAFGQMAAACRFTNPRQLWRVKQAWQLLKGLMLKDGSGITVLRPWMRVLFLREYMLQIEPGERQQIENWLVAAGERGPVPRVVEALADGPARSSFADYDLLVTAVNTVLLPAAPRTRRG